MGRCPPLSTEDASVRQGDPAVKPWGPPQARHQAARFRPVGALSALSVSPLSGAASRAGPRPQARCALTAPADAIAPTAATPTVLAVAGRAASRRRDDCSWAIRMEM